ncbi:MAG: sigma-70 family RNA polymerase sigma factor [Actinomycetota bacterium]|nr:sigma-70 family RNA polymerase sigma factor [Actinomycetota bacterium]
MTATDSRFEESMCQASIEPRPRPRRRFGPDDDVVELVSAAAAGDGRAYEALVQRYSGLVWATARAYGLSSEDAADVSQFVWIRLVQNLGRINEPAKLGGWLCTVTRNEAFRVLRKSSREIAVIDLAGFEAGRFGSEFTAGSDPEAIGSYGEFRLLLEERNAELWRAVDELPCQCSALIRCLFSDSRPSYQAIAAQLDIPVGSIGPTRQRCLDRLRRSSAFQGINEQSDGFFTGEKGESA